MPAPPAPSYRLTLLGPWDLRGPDNTRVGSVLSQPKRLCLLAYLALAGEPVTRSKLVALFWPESDEEKARNALSQAIHYLRRSLTTAAIESVEGDRIVVRPETVWFDARQLLVDGGTAYHGGESAEGRGVEAGQEFFPGWNADDSQPLQEWLDGVRRRVARAEPSASPVDVTESLGERAAGSLSDGSKVARQPDAGTPTVERQGTAVLRWVAPGVALVIIAGLIWSASQPAERGMPAPANAGDVANGVVVAVLLPRLSTTATSSPISGEAIQAEIAARFAAQTGVRVRSLPFDIDRFRLLVRDEAGAPQDPVWVVNVIVLAGEGRARVVSALLTGPGYTDTASGSSLELTISTEDEALLDLPRQVALDVANAFGPLLYGPGTVQGR